MLARDLVTLFAVTVEILLILFGFSKEKPESVRQQFSAQISASESSGNVEVDDIWFFKNTGSYVDISATGKALDTPVREH